MPAWSRILRALFVAYLAATAIHIAFIINHEPFAFDAWNVAVDTHAEPFTFGRFTHYIVDQYTHSNPRVGQPLTYLAYKLFWFAPIVTPLAWLLLSLAVVVLGLGRWPSWRRDHGKDLALWAMALGFGWFAFPEIGKILFCRAYCANYVYGAVIQLWFLVPLRLNRTGDTTPGKLALYAVAGVIAGMCNEHTGPTLIVFLIAYAWWQQREAGPRANLTVGGVLGAIAAFALGYLRIPIGRRTTPLRPTLAWAGSLGAILGFSAIFFAPGQGERYDGLAAKVTLWGRLLQRGVTANLDIFRDFVIAAAPMMALLAVVLVIAAVRDPDSTSQLGADEQAARRRAIAFVGVVAAGGTLITMTLFVSPKLGSRFYLVSMALLLAAFIGVADRVLSSTARLIPFVVLAVLTSGYAASRTVPLFRRLAVEGDARIAALEASKPGEIVTAISYEQVDDSWWFLGDDFRDPKKRDMITDYFALGGVILRAVDLTAPLGVSDVRLVPRYVVSPASCLDELGGLELGAFKSLDVASIEAASRAAIDALRTRLPTGARLDQLDVVVSFVGTPPVLPRKTLLLGRWTPTHWETYAGAIQRNGASRTRELVVPAALKHQPFDMYIYQVGGEARRLGTTNGEPLTYIPWKSGAYWELACNADVCFVLAATRQTS